MKKCYSDEPLAIPLDGLHIDDKLHFVEEPVEIMDREVKRLKQSYIPIVKVWWNSRRGPEFTWEREDQFPKKRLLAQEDLPNVSEERAKELDDLMMRMTETDWFNLMMQVGSNPALARELLGADVTEANFVERMTAIKERKKRALEDLRYRALKGKPLKQSEVTQMMRNLVKNQWCAAHHGTITMKAIKAMSKQQLSDEYEYICRRLEKDRLLNAQYNLKDKGSTVIPHSHR
ncbi:hypothetical protein Tco_0553308, partial [Tanacetum coccineum]